jgi:cytochrome oxidase assembly protein ShyY1
MSGRRRQVLLSPTWIMRTVGALLVIAGCIAAAVWQYHRTADQVEVAQAAASLPVDYAELVPSDRSLDPGQLGRNVIVTGVVTDDRTLVRDRLSPAGEVGYLVVDGVRIADDRTVAVLQGWVSRRADAPDRVGRQITVAGRLQPDENFYPDAPVAPTGPLVTITNAGLGQQWGTAPGQGYVTVTGAPGAAGFALVPPIIGTDPDVPFPLQNAFYSLQWLIFAGAVVYVWVRFLREDLRTADSAPEPERVSL